MNPKSLLPLVDVLFPSEEREEVRARLLAEPVPYWKTEKGKEYVKKYRRLPKYREYQRKYWRSKKFHEYREKYRRLPKYREYQKAYRRKKGLMK